MKRCVVLFALLSILLCACSVRKEKLVKPVNFYYLNQTVTYNSPSGMISPEIREGADYGEDILSLINAYAKGPISQLYISPFPDRLEILALTETENTAFLTVSDQLCMLTGHNLTLACVCLSRTVMDITGTDTVQISVPDRLIDGKTSLTICTDDLIFIDSSSYTPSTSE